MEPDGSKGESEMTLNQLYYFVATCDNGNNMTSASKSLFVTQSAISCAIKELEEEFQIQLFIRGKKVLYLTEAGKEFYKLASQVIADANRLVEAFDSRQREFEPPRLGLSTLTSNIFTDVLRTYEDEHPYSPIRKFVLPQPKLYEFLNQGVLQTIIVGWSAGDAAPNCEVRQLGRHRCALYVHKDHPLAVRSKVTAEDLTDLPICYFVENEGLMTPEHPGLTEQYVPGLELKNVQGVTTYLSVVNEFLRENRGGAIVASGIHFDDEDIRELPIEGAEPFRIAAVWKKGQLPQGMEELMKKIQDQLEKR